MFVFAGLIALLFLLLVSAWISAAEIGITSLSKYRVKKLIVQNPKFSKALLLWLKQPYYLLTIILTVNVIADMLASFVSVYVMTSVFCMVNRNVIEVLIWIFTSLFLLIFVEMVPKFYARMVPERITIRSVPILSKIEKILKPFMYPIVKIAEFLSPKTSNINNSYELSNEEIKNLLSEGDYTGEIDKDTGSMLEHTLCFGELSAKRIMTPFKDIRSVDLSLEEKEFLDKAIEISKSRIPVYVELEKNIIGYVHIKDILMMCQKNKGHFIRPLVKEPYYISEDQKINILLKQFQNGKTHMAFVKDKNDDVIGMVTLEDILEEVVGEIIDEYEFEK
ncbi:MAG: CNNM domain-containing protein [Endomicrobium sp.]|jgi:putative hemolysin|nr:CNNM domain-containing protein [Endomicrobium sp.]